MSKFEHINCPLCGSENHKLWATENGFNCVKCVQCGLLFVNPRPDGAYVQESVKLGWHAFEDGTHLNTKTRRVVTKQRHFERMIKQMFPDLMKHSPVSWLDVGAGYGEFVQALINNLPVKSVVEGLEPMTHKAQHAQERGVPVRHGLVHDVTDRVDFVSLIDVFSHIPDFHQFLSDTKKLLLPNGEILLKTGNAADVGERKNFPGPLNLPDHLAFAGVTQLTRFLETAGFELITIREERIDVMWYAIKNLIKKMRGQPVHLSLPFTSPTRSLWIRARLKD